MKKLLLIISCLCIVLNQNAQTELWGMTETGGFNNKGVMFEYSISNNNCTNKLDFAGTTNGSLPRGSLMKASDGKLYGMTSNGGQNGFGTIFQYDLSTGLYTKKFDFDGVVHGSFPIGTLMQATDGNLYGLTCQGGTTDKGVIFQYDINTGACTKLLDFNGVNNGLNPNGNLMQFSDGMLYGLTVGGGGGVGGSNNNGELFQFDPITHILIKKVVLTGGATGFNPFGSLVQAIDGKLYGMTLLGGGSGLIFQYDPSSNAYAVKVNLGTPSNPGSQPWGSLISASDGKLYGMTEIGGVNNSGVLFQYDPVSNVYTKKIDFDGINIGSNPKGTLMQASNGSIYGLTTKGGVKDLGVLFQYDPIANILSKKLDFDSINGSLPRYTSLIEVPSIPTVIEKLINADNLLLYPNPNNGSFIIELNIKSQINITNVLGEIVFNQSLEPGKQNIDILSQANGVYFVKVTDTKGVSAVKKIMKQ
jgi:uncharacterized repeat protein (TIGR03803 family)